MARLFLTIAATTLGLLLLNGCSETARVPAESQVIPVQCGHSQYQAIDQRLSSGDGHGHGPDIGSDEWKSVIEFRLGVRGQPQVPPRQSAEWCDFVFQSLQRQASQPDGPAFDCSQSSALNTIEQTICADEWLSALDRKMAAVYAAAQQKARNEHPPVLAAEQRGWIKGRNECWKETHPRDCAGELYERRIAELQARYQLIAASGPVFFSCDGNPAKEVVVTFYRTNPATLIAEFGDSVSLMYQVPGIDGLRYEGRNELFRKTQDGTTIRWGYGAPPMRCQNQP